MQEVWRDIEGYEGLYQVSDMGRVQSMDRMEIGNRNAQRHRNYCLRKPRIIRRYLSVILSKKGERKNIRVHRLVAKAFIPNPNNYPQVNHINGDKLDNRAINLEWCTGQQNMDHAYANNLINPVCGENVSGAKLKEGEVVEIRRLRDLGVSAVKLANQFGRGLGTIYDVLNRRTWKHIQ